MLWALGNALVKTFTVTIQKFIGLASQTFGHVAFVAFIVSLLQVSVGFAAIKYQKLPLLPNKKGLIGSCVYGFNVFWVTALSFYIFKIGGDLLVSTFIISLGIILGTLADKFFFKEPFVLRQWLGIFLAVCAAYIVLGLPSLAEIIALPPWVFLSSIVMLLGAMNSVLTRYVKNDVTGFQRNFWGGLSMLCAAIFFIPFWGIINPSLEVADQTIDLVKLGILSGIGAVIIWNLGLLSYKYGAYIALETLIVYGVLLSLIAISGWIFFGEGNMPVKFIGILVYLTAFSVVDNKTWNFFASLGRKWQQFH